MTEILVYQLLLAGLFGVIIGGAIGVYIGSVIARWHHAQAMEHLADITTTLQDSPPDLRTTQGPIEVPRERLRRERYR